MAKLIVTRARQVAHRFRRFRIVIDGRQVAMIAPGKTVEIELTVGHHELSARLDFLESPPVVIEAGPEGVYSLRIGSNMFRRNPLGFFLLVPILALIGFLTVLHKGGALFSDPQELAWFTFFIAPTFGLSISFLILLMVIWRHRFLYVEELPTADSANRPVIRPHVPIEPLRVRITIRQLMIWVALVAIVLGAVIGWARFTRETHFRNRARAHASLEVAFRQTEHLYVHMANENQNSGPIADFARKSAARMAAVVDHHAALRRKYEEAASRHLFLVAPDPPEPPLP
jgi:hypothetical protein